LIDFVIPSHPKDFESLVWAVAGIRTNISCAGRIFVVADIDPGIDGVGFVYRNAGSVYGELVTVSQIEDVWAAKNPELAWRAGWIYQQMVKLLTPRAIEDLTNAYVIVDADTIFLRDVVFDPQRFFYCKATEYHLPYLQPIKDLLGVSQTIGFSATAHHMIYRRDLVEQMLTGVEARFGYSFVDAVLSVIDYVQISNFNEQDLWANYMLLTHPDLCHQRQLAWADIGFIPDEAYLGQAGETLDFVACHAWMRE
jgi:hypothetical protein